MHNVFSKLTKRPFVDFRRHFPICRQEIIDPFPMPLASGVSEYRWSILVGHPSIWSERAFFTHQQSAGKFERMDYQTWMTAGGVGGYFKVRREFLPMMEAMISGSLTPQKKQRCRDCALVLSHLINLAFMDSKTGKHFPYFRCSRNRIKSDLLLSERGELVIMKLMEDHGYIERKMLGNPAKRHVKLMHEKIESDARKALFGK